MKKRTQKVKKTFKKNKKLKTASTKKPKKATKMQKTEKVDDRLPLKFNKSVSVAIIWLPAWMDMMVRNRIAFCYHPGYKNGYRKNNYWIRFQINKNDLDKVAELIKDIEEYKNEPSPFQ